MGHFCTAQDSHYTYTHTTMVKFAPVALASVFALTNALNVDEFINELATQVYHVSDDGLTESISLEPYFEMTKTSRPDGFDVVGTYGPGAGEQVEFERHMTFSNDGFELTTRDHGSMDATIFAMVDPSMQGHNFDMSHTVQCVAADMMCSWEEDGSIDNHNYHAQETIRVSNFQTGRIKTTGTLNLQGAYTADPQIVMMDPLATQPFSHNFDVTAECNGRCEGPSGPLGAGCQMSLGVEGTFNNEAIPELLVKLKAFPDKFNVKVLLDNSQVAMIKLEYNQHELYALYFKEGEGDFAHVISVPGPGRFGRIAEAVEQYVAPFVVYIQAAVENADRFAHAAVWVDRAWNDLTNEFDCSAVVAATGIESGILAAELGAPSIQEMAQGYCVQFNEMAVGGLQQAGEGVKAARKYVNDLTNPRIGGVKYNRWLKQVYA